MNEFHFLRPWWLLTSLIVLGLMLLMWRQRPHLDAWEAVCDKHLLKHLIQFKGKKRRVLALSSVYLSALFLCISLAGPTWSRLPVPAFIQIQPRVLILDLSNTMLTNDVLPDRLTRAKFKLHDLFKQKDKGQFGLVVYTGEPFVVSPLTDDAHTIDALLSSLSPEIMPVEGQQLDSALREAKQLISNAGYKEGQVLVLTGDMPSQAAINAAKELSNHHISTSVIPINASKSLSPQFQELARAGEGQLIPFTDNNDDLDKWLNQTSRSKKFSYQQNNDIPLWKDQGRWFLLPALLLLLPAFRRGWIQRIDL